KNLAIALVIVSHHDRSGAVLDTQVSSKLLDGGQKDLVRNRKPLPSRKRGPVVNHRYSPSHPLCKVGHRNSVRSGTKNQKIGRCWNELEEKVTEAGFQPPRTTFSQHRQGRR